MPFSHYISGGIAWLIGSGRGDLHAWRAAMGEILSDPCVAPDMPMLWDFRCLEQLLLEPGEPAEVAETLVTLAPSHPVALITKRPAAFAAALRLEAVSHGQVMAFDTDVSGAIRWLHVHQVSET